ncbi:MAG: hypothetical protein CMP66_00760 [Flavobacteriales bacterium]|nr:hypothetical protein [Flavobacteriales bacterium]|tara:strand:+ start:96 stop:476 length:381 start_codon:yes stop_codon:yes gene_type:complete
MVRRFGIFLFGILLGVAFVRFAFPGRFAEMGRYFSLDYRVMYHLQQDTIYMSPLAKCHLDCLELDQSKVLSVLDGGEVNFDKSKKNAIPCKLYTVEKEELSVLFELCEEKVKVRDFSFGADTCKCH